MISQREIERRVRNLEATLKRQPKVFVYCERDGDIDAERTAIIQRRCKQEFGFDARNGDMFVSLPALNWVHNDQLCPNFRHDFILKIGNQDYNDGWPFSH